MKVGGTVGINRPVVGVVKETLRADLDSVDVVVDGVVERPDSDDEQRRDESGCPKSFDQRWGGFINDGRSRSGLSGGPVRSPAGMCRRHLHGARWHSLPPARAQVVLHPPPRAQSLDRRVLRH